MHIETRMLLVIWLMSLTGMAAFVWAMVGVR